MRWFKHFALASQDGSLAELLEDLGPAGYGVYWLILERIALQLDEKNNPEITLSWKKWSQICSISQAKLQKVVDFCENLKLFRVIHMQKRGTRMLTINAPILLEYQDNWTKQKIRESEKTPGELQSNFEVTSKQIRLDKDRIEERRGDAGGEGGGMGGERRRRHDTKRRRTLGAL